MTKVEEISESELMQGDKIKEIISLDDDDYTDVDSEDSIPLISHDESLLERITALVDIVPPVTRVKFQQRVQDVGDWALDAFHFVGAGLWIISTASLMTIFPLALELEREGAIIDQEIQQRSSQQQAQQVIDF